MRLRILTPQAVIVDCEALHVRAEDDSGAFGVLDRHAALLTALSISVVVYRDLQRREHFVAVRGGLLTVTAGGCVQVLTREAVAGDDLASLQGEVLARLRKSEAAEGRARAGASRLEAALLARLAERARVDGSPLAGGRS